ncbi:hypothetical protein QCA50_003246 [Cerrena zonata]|uniref:HNH nuclease domain-containing protein n=1 Tax=Cerrena zonata TaxID=2478898 RepID=A0AAW0GVU9_9APHY
MAFRPQSPPINQNTLPNWPRNIDIKHPYYNPPLSLICFSAYDVDPNSTDEPRRFGVDHRVALDACRILANNRDGFLSRVSRRNDLTARLTLDEMVLTESIYYYFLDDESAADYPIVNNFLAWTFPAGHIPTHWLQTRPRQSEDLRQSYWTIMSDAVIYRDGRCCLTSFKADDSSDCAYLVPKDQAAWYELNAMDVYNFNRDIHSVDDISNGICLRSDVHRCLERRSFVPFPVDGSFVAHFIRREPNYADLLHRKEMLIHEIVSIEFLYARFALNVISRVSQYPLMKTIPVPVLPGKKKKKKKAKLEQPLPIPNVAIKSEPVAAELFAKRLKQTIFGFGDRTVSAPEQIQDAAAPKYSCQGPAREMQPRCGNSNDRPFRFTWDSTFGNYSKVFFQGSFYLEAHKLAKKRHNEMAEFVQDEVV